MINYYPKLQSGEYFHVFNRGNNKEKIFYKDANYHLFLNKMREYIVPYAAIYVYSLLPNHFHLLIRVKPFIEFPVDVNPLLTPEELISNQFRLFFMSYSKSINYQEGRTGSLLQKSFRRKCICQDAYFSFLVFYIHTNAQKHKLIKNFREYPYTSFQQICCPAGAWLEQLEVLNWFGGIPEYYNYHLINEPLIQLDEIREAIQFK